MLQIIHNYMNCMKTYLNNETIYLDKKSPAHLKKNKLIKGNLNFNNLNFFECEVSLELPSFVVRNSVQTIFDTGHTADKNFALTLRTFRTKPFFQIAWLINGIALTKTLYYGKFAHIKFGFDLKQSIMWLDIADINTKSISKDINFTNLPFVFGRQIFKKTTFLRNFKRIFFSKPFLGKILETNISLTKSNRLKVFKQDFNEKKVVSLLKNKEIFEASNMIVNLIDRIKASKNYRVKHNDSFMKLLPSVISSHHNLLHNFYPFSLEEFYDESSLLLRAGIDPRNNYKKEKIFWTEIYFSNKLCTDYLESLGRFDFPRKLSNLINSKILPYFTNIKRAKRSRNSLKALDQSLKHITFSEIEKKWKTKIQKQTIEIETNHFKVELWQFFELSKKKLLSYNSKVISALYLSEFMNSDKETKIEHACIETFKYIEKYTSKSKKRNLEINLILGSLIILSKPFVHNSIAGWVFLDKILDIISDINSNRNNKENFFMTEYILGELNLILGDSDKSCFHFKNITNHDDTYILSKIANSLQMSGKIKESINYHKQMMHISGQTNFHDNTFKHLSWLETWDEKEIKYVDYVDKLDVKNTELKQFIPSFESNNGDIIVGKIIRKANLSDHKFLIKININWKSQIKKELEVLKFENHRTLKLKILRDGKIHLKIGDGKSWILDTIHSERLYYGNNSITILRDTRDTSFIINNVINNFSSLKEFVIPSTFLLVKCLTSNIKDFKIKIEIEKYSLSNERNDYKNITVYTSFYGEEFLELLHISLFPSLFAKDNLLNYPPEKIFWKIYTTKEQIKKLQNIKKECQDIGIKFEIDTSIMGSENGNPRENLGKTVIDCINYSIKHKSLMIIAPPDHVFGHGILNIINNFNPFEYIVLAHPRIEYETGVSTLNNYFKIREKDKYNFSLIKWAMEKVPHSVVKNGLYKKSKFNTNWWNGTKTSNGYKVSFKEPPPLIFYPTLDLVTQLSCENYTPPFESIDHEIVDLMEAQNRLVMINDSKTFFWVEYCKKYRNYPTLVNDYWSPTARKLSKTFSLFKTK